MAFQRTGKLLTSETIRGGLQVGQVVPLVSNRLDKFSAYLEATIPNEDILANALVEIEVYAVDGSNIPSGPPIISRSRLASDIKNEFFNMPVEAALPTKVAVVIRFQDGNLENYLSWRYVDGVDSSDEPVLVSTDGGASWVTKTNRKLSYVAYSSVSGAVTLEEIDSFGFLPPDEPPDRTTDQSATIQTANSKDLIDDTEAEFELQELNRTVVDGDTVVVEFGDFLVTLVVDHSGSMTWNDNKGLRFDFLKTYIQDLDNILPPSSDITFNILKFNSRKVGKIKITLQEDTEAKNAFVGIRVVRKAGSIPVSGPTDGVVIYEGLADEFLDKNLITGTQYQYGIFAYNRLGVFSPVRTATATPIALPKFPMGVASFSTEEVVVLNGTYDIGKRKINISWVHPSTDDSDFAYNNIVLVRRTDRFPENESDGTVLLDLDDSDIGYDGPYLDFNAAGPVTDQTLYAVAGQTYYYSMFTKNSSNTSCLNANVRRSSVLISQCDRFWEKLEPPANDPSLYGFDDTNPTMPSNVTVEQADKELRITWSAGSVDSVRYEIYFQPDAYPQLIQDSETGNLSISGELIYNCDANSFIHRNLENDEPNFYAIIAYDYVANKSNVYLFEGKAKSITNTVTPAEPTNVTAEPYNSTSNRILWLALEEENFEATGYFGDEIRVQTTVSFADQLAFINIGTLELKEDSKVAYNLDQNGEVIAVALNSGDLNETITQSATSSVSINDVVSPRVAMNFASELSTNTNTVAAIFSANPLINIRNRLDRVELTAHGQLTVRNRSTGELITGIRTQQVSLTLLNPLNLSFSSNQSVSRRNWSLTCDNEKAPNETTEDFPGVYVQTGQSFVADLVAMFRGENLEEDLSVSVRILDIDTDQPSKAIILPDSDQNGVSVFTLTGVQEELTDRTGQPTGIFKTTTKFELVLPPQDIPGDYILEATASYRGYSRLIRYRVNFEPSLNIDVNAVPFFADGVSSSEQSAFVYLGSPVADPEDKLPAENDVVVTWNLIPLDSISKANASKRPLYSRDNVTGTGIKSKTINGTAKKVFFGPATDIGIVSNDPAVQSDAESDRALTSCITEGEIYAISATANYRGMTTTSYGFVQLNNFELLEENQLNRIFLRSADANEFSQTTIYADGIQEASFEVLANPAIDGSINDYTSGAFFNNAITTLGGLVPVLEEGTLIYANVKVYHGSTEGQKVMIRTNLTGSKGVAYNATASIENGKALFHVRLNTVVAGKVKEKPLIGEQGSNIIYGDPEFLDPDPSPLIIAISVRAAVRINGRVTGFYGGGFNVQSSTPPCFISFQEPLGLEVSS